MIERGNNKLVSQKKSKGRDGDGHGERKVEFILFAPEASNVSLAGDFNSWDTQSLPMKKDKKGTWKVKTKLSPGRYEYKFFMDNSWVEELLSEEKVTTPFGSQNLVKWVE
jgi:1,4-alpha-glucan branching enzyme